MTDPTSPLADLAPPVRSFASDNFAGVHPAVLAAIGRADADHQPAYGDDIHTARCAERFNELFDADVITRLTFNGTGANILALATLMGHLPGPHHAIVCSSWAHINIDETGAPERILGTKLIDLASDDGKITPDQLREVGHLQGNVHHVQPGIVSITQPTELGALYTPAEIKAICDTAHEMGMLVHIDGARIANATAALGGTREALRSFTIDTGVDVLSFGGTKIGAMGAEAVVFLNPRVAAGSEYLRKQVTQLSSKMRYLAAQFNGLLADELWIGLGANANRMAGLLHAQVADLPAIDLGPAPEANSMYPFLPKEILGPLQQWSFFWDWDESRNQVRWMAGWDTSQADVDQFVGGIRLLLELDS